MTPPDLTRREFVLAGTTALVGTVQAQQQDYKFSGAAILHGPSTARPAPGSAFFDNKLAYQYIYLETDHGRQFQITDDDTSWTLVTPKATEEGTETYSSSGTDTKQLSNTYQHAAANVGADQNDGNASWYGWETNSDGHITGLNITHDLAGLSSMDVVWYVSGIPAKGGI